MNKITVWNKIEKEFKELNVHEAIDYLNYRVELTRGAVLWYLFFNVSLIIYIVWWTARMIRYLEP